MEAWSGSPFPELRATFVRRADLVFPSFVVHVVPLDLQQERLVHEVRELVGGEQQVQGEEAVATGPACSTSTRMTVESKFQSPCTV